MGLGLTHWDILPLLRLLRNLGARPVGVLPVPVYAGGHVPRLRLQLRRMSSEPGEEGEEAEVP